MPVRRRAPRLRDRLDGTRADRRRSIRRGRGPLSVAPPIAPAAPRRCRVGPLRKQSPRALLHADPGRPRAIEGRDGELAPLRAGGRRGVARSVAMGRKPFWYLRRRDVKAEVDEEINLHIEMRIDELVKTGMPRDEARREAVRQFGDLERTRRYCREQDETRENAMQRTLSIQDLSQDLRIGIRSLLRVPLLTLTI